MLAEMFSEQEKAIETIKWMKLFQRIIEFADQNSISHQGFYNILKKEVDNVIEQCNKITENE